MHWNSDYPGKRHAVGTDYAYTATRVGNGWRLAVLDGIMLTAIAYHTERRLADIVAIADRFENSSESDRDIMRREFRP